MIIERLYKTLRASTLAKDSFWALLGNAFARGFSLLAGIVVANFLGNIEYGEYGLVRNTLLLIATLSTLGLGYTGTKFISEYSGDVSKRKYLVLLTREILRITLCFSSVIAFLIFLFAHPLAHFLEDTTIVDAIRLLAVVIILNALTTAQIGILAGFKSFTRMSQINIIAGFCNFIFTVCCTYYWGFIGSLYGFLFSQIVNCILNYVVISNILKDYSVFSGMDISARDVRITLIRFSLPIALQELSYSLCSWGTSVLALKMTDYGEIGLYSASIQWTSIVLFIPGVLRNVALSYMSEKQSKSSRRTLFKRMLIINGCSTLFPAIIATLFSVQISNWYGGSFSDLPPVLILGMVGAVLQSLHNVCASEFMARSWIWLMYIIATIRDVGGILLCYVFIQYLEMSGAMSLAMSSAFAALLALSLSFMSIKLKTN